MNKFTGKPNQPTYLESGPLTEKWPENDVKPELMTGLCPPSIHVDDQNGMTLTEKWIADLKAKREAAIASGQYFDGQEHDNVVSFDRRKDEEYDAWDSMPSDCNPD